MAGLQESPVDPERLRDLFAVMMKALVGEGANDGEVLITVTQLLIAYSTACDLKKSESVEALTRNWDQPLTDHLAGALASQGPKPNDAPDTGDWFQLSIEPTRAATIMAAVMKALSSAAKDQHFVSSRELQMALTATLIANCKAIELTKLQATSALRRNWDNPVSAQLAKTIKAGAATVQ